MNSGLRQQLWDFFKAAFPNAGYLLCSATMTDAAVTDIQSMRQSLLYVFSLHNPTLIGSLRLQREDLVVLFKPPTRSNIFLQVKPYFDIIETCPSEIKVREHSTPQDDDHEPLWSFLVPVIADESLQSVQIFFQKKLLLNAASMPSNSYLTTNTFPPLRLLFQVMC